VGSRFSRIAAPVLGLLAVLAAVGFVLAAPHLLKSSRDEAAIPAPPAGSGEVASVVAPPLQTPPGGRVPPLGPSESPAPGSTATPPLAGPSLPGLGPAERPSGGGISATPQPGVGEEPESRAPAGHGDGHGAKKPSHKGHHGHGNGHEHHGNGKGVGHSGDQNGDRDDGSRHDNGNHNGWTKPKKDPPAKSHDSLGSGHGHGKSDRGNGSSSKHGKSHRGADSHARSRR
jgi:hypothetical protein